MCVNAKISSPEIVEAVGTVALSRLSLFKFDELRQHTGNNFLPCALMHNGSNRTRKVDVVDHDLGDDG